MDALTHYEILGVSETATSAEISRAYRTIMREYHPDVNPSEEAAEKSSLANIAKTVLLDPIKREEYDKSLHEPEPVEEEWEPTWGEEVSWGEGFEADVVEEEASSFDDLTTFDEKDYGPIVNLPPVNIPESLIEAPITFKSKFPAAMLALSLSIFAPILAMLTQPYQSQAFGLLLQIISVGGVIAAFLAVRKWNVRWSWDWMYQSGVFLIGYFGLIVLLMQLPSGEVARTIFPLLFGLVITFLLAPSFWHYIDQRKYLKPRALKKNNSFGNLNGTIEEQLVEDALNELWQVKGVRVFRVWHHSFTHIVIFGNRAVLVKGVTMHNKGVLTWSGPALLNRYAPHSFEKVLEEGYTYHLKKFFAYLPKTVKVFPMIAAFPMGYLQSFDNNGLSTIVAGEDLTALIAQVLFKDNEANIVDHEVVTALHLAAFRGAH